MVKIGFDISALDPAFKAHAHRGIGRYVRELRGYFDQIKRVSYDGRSAIEYFDHTTFFSGKIVKPFLAALPAGVNTVRQQILFPLQLSFGASSHLNFVHFPAHMDAPSWSFKPYVVTVLDLIPLILKDIYAPERGNWRFHFARWLEIRAIKGASFVLAISENTAHDVHRILGIPYDRIAVTPLGVDDRFFKSALKEEEATLRARYKIPADRPIILYVGGIDPRKNILVAVQALHKVLGKVDSDKRPVFVMAGRIQSDKQYPILQREIDRLGIGEDVICPGFVPDEDLFQIYSISTLFLFPSLYEGFGLPPLEAMAAGLPVISSNTSCMPEVLGSAAIYVDPNDPDQIAEEILGLLQSPDKCRELGDIGRLHARHFTWERTGQTTMEAYAQASKILGL